ncbi:unnamed protein product, partial [Porites evermanni]
SFLQIKLVTEAIKLDEDAKLKEAAELYCEAMAFFLPAIEYEKDPEMKARLRERDCVTSKHLYIFPQFFKHRRVSLMLGHWMAIYPVDRAIVHLAQLLFLYLIFYKDEHGAYESALPQYQIALEALLPILSGTPRGPYKEALHLEATFLLSIFLFVFVQVAKYMRRAEEIKLYIKLSKERMKVIPSSVEEDQSRECYLYILYSM